MAQNTVFMGLYWFLLVFMGVYWFLFVFMGFYLFLWVFVVFICFYGFLWFFIGFYGSLCVFIFFMGFYLFLWVLSSTNLGVQKPEAICTAPTLGCKIQGDLSATIVSVSGKGHILSGLQQKHLAKAPLRDPFEYGPPTRFLTTRIFKF